MNAFGASIPPPSVSVVTLTYNHLDFVVRLRASLDAHLSGFDWEWLVGDAGSDGTSEWLRDRGDPRTVVLRLPNDVGFARNCNSLASHARGSVLAFCNNDVVLLSSWLPSLAEVFSDPGVAVLGPMILGLDRAIQSFGMGVDPTAANGTCDLAWPLAPRGRFLVPMVTGALMFVRASAFWSAGGFDEDYKGGYFEDSDLCLRVLAVGGRCVVDSAIKAFHVGQGSRDVSALYWRELPRNRELFRRRWSARFEELAAVGAVPYRPLARGICAAAVDRWLPVMGGGERECLRAVMLLARHCDAVSLQCDETAEARLDTIRTGAHARFGVTLPANVVVERRRGRPTEDIVWDHTYYEIPTVVAPNQKYWKRICAVPPDAPAASSRASLVANSRFTREASRHVGRCGLLYPPVTPVLPAATALQAAASKEPVVLFVGRFSRREPYLTWKNHDLLCDAFACYAPERLRLVLLGGAERGDPPFRPKVSGDRIAVEANAGFDTVVRCYRSARYFVSLAGCGGGGTATQEHFGIAAVEAMSAGCVPILFDGGGHREVVEDGVSGFLVRTAEEGFRRIAELEECSEKRLAMARGAIARSMMFGPGIFDLTVEHQLSLWVAGRAL